MKRIDIYVPKTYSGFEVRVDLAPVEKQLRRLPAFIVTKLRKWMAQVEIHGILEMRKVSGLHDEPLKGSRKGQRSIRLSKGYRAIYSEHTNGIIRIIRIEEVHKHVY